MQLDPEEYEIKMFLLDPPSIGPGQWPIKSPLFLLRRDLRDLAIPEAASLDNAKVTAPILAAFGIMAGFEMLAKIWHGTHDVRQREFESALRHMAAITPAQARMAVIFRNAIGHGYTLTVLRRKDGKTYRFRVDDAPSRALLFRRKWTKEGYLYEVSFWRLRALFLRSINELRNRLLEPANKLRRSRFQRALKHLPSYIITTTN